MSTVSNGPTSGQPTDPPAATSTTEPTLISVMERNIAALVRMTAVLTSLADRIEVLEDHVELLETDAEDQADGGDVEPLTEPNPAPLTPPLALRCDGRALLSVADLDGVDLSAREMFVGVVLTEAETSDLMERLDDAYHDAAAHMAASLRKRGKK